MRKTPLVARRALTSATAASGRPSDLSSTGADYGVARLRETLIKDCPKFGNWHDPCRAYYVGLNEWWAEQPRNEPAAPTQRPVARAAKTGIGG